MKENKIKVISIFRPGLVVVSGQKYVVPGWQSVSMETQLSDIDWELPEYITRTKNNVTKIQSSSSKNIYTVTQRGDSWSCTCPAGKFRGMCKHINQVKESN